MLTYKLTLLFCVWNLKVDLLIEDIEFYYNEWFLVVDSPFSLDSLNYSQQTKHMGLHVFILSASKC